MLQLTRIGKNLKAYSKGMGAAVAFYVLHVWSFDFFIQIVFHIEHTILFAWLEENSGQNLVYTLF